MHRYSEILHPTLQYSPDCTTVQLYTALCRRCTRPPLSWYPQFSVQARPPTWSVVNIFLLSFTHCMFSEGLPSTFLGKHGWVQYYCKSALKEASGLAHKNQQVFIVMNPIDLNQEPAILAVSIAIDNRQSKVFSCKSAATVPL